MRWDVRHRFNTVAHPSLFGLDGMSSGAVLEACHYLGASTRGDVYRDDYGLMVFANPSSRRLPQGGSWLELVRWCITAPVDNGGSRQWAGARRWLLKTYPKATTVVSYSDPSAGHTGALYRACNWLWAPTWHRLREPPTGNGSWDDDTRQGVKDRWIFPLRRDVERSGFLRIHDDGLRAAMPWAEYREVYGGDYRRWLREGKRP